MSKTNGFGQDNGILYFFYYEQKIAQQHGDEQWVRSLNSFQ